MEQELHQPMELPPGFRFHPTDEELITHYLARKIADHRFAALAVSEADLNKCEPWDLPAGEDGGEGVVLLLPQGPQVPDGAEDEPGHGGRVLEGHGQGQGDLQGEGPRRLQEDARLLHREGAQGREVRLGHARVPPPRQAPRRHAQGRVQERVGSVQGVQEEPYRRPRRRAGGQKGCHRDGGEDGRRHGNHLSPPSADGRVRRHQPRGGTRDLLLQRAGGPVVPKPNGGAASRRRRHGSQSRPRLLLAVPLQLRAVRVAAPRRGKPSAAPGKQRRPTGHAQAPAAAGAAVQGRRAAERVAGHRAHLRRAPRDLLLRPTVRPRAAVGLLSIISFTALMAINIALAVNKHMFEMIDRSRRSSSYAFAMICSCDYCRLLIEDLGGVVISIIDVCNHDSVQYFLG